MLVVVVLPWVPVTAIAACRRVSSPSRSPRCSSAARARGRPARGSRRDRGRVDDLGAPAGTFAAAWPTSGSIPAARRRSSVRATRRGRSRSPPRRARAATSARPLIPAPPIPTKCSRRPRARARRPSSLRRPPRRAREHLGGDARGVAGGASAARARPPSPRSARRVVRPARRPRGQALRRQLGVGDRHRGAGLGHPAGVGGLVVGRRRAGRGSGPPAGRAAAISNTEPPARATTRSAASERRAERRRCSRAGRSAGRAPRSARSRARPAACRTWKRRVGERLDRGLVDRAGAERAAEHEHAGSSAASPKRARAAARSVAGGGTGRPVTR